MSTHRRAHWPPVSVRQQSANFRRAVSDFGPVRDHVADFQFRGEMSLRTFTRQSEQLLLFETMWIIGDRCQRRELFPAADKSKFSDEPKWRFARCLAEQSPPHLPARKRHQSIHSRKTQRIGAVGARLSFRVEDAHSDSAPEAHLTARTLNGRNGSSRRAAPSSGQRRFRTRHNPLVIRRIKLGRRCTTGCTAVL